MFCVKALIFQVKSSSSFCIFSISKPCAFLSMAISPAMAVFSRLRYSISRPSSCFVTSFSAPNNSVISRKIISAAIIDSIRCICFLFLDWSSSILAERLAVKVSSDSTNVSICCFCCSFLFCSSSTLADRTACSSKVRMIFSSASCCNVLNLCEHCSTFSIASSFSRRYAFDSSWSSSLFLLFSSSSSFTRTLTSSSCDLDSFMDASFSFEKCDTATPFSSNKSISLDMPPAAIIVSICCFC
mmetsp:Transcript_3301/g.5323  ORF Transcript_3301/g.5323 Transcript_3301/m.5323 type:complete len:242 (-) Transcript_3301:984-1709(-)